MRFCPGESKESNTPQPTGGVGEFRGLHAGGFSGDAGGHVKQRDAHRRQAQKREAIAATQRTAEPALLLRL